MEWIFAVPIITHHPIMMLRHQYHTTLLKSHHQFHNISKQKNHQRVSITRRIPSDAGRQHLLGFLAPQIRSIITTTHLQSTFLSPLLLRHHHHHSSSICHNNNISPTTTTTSTTNIPLVSLPHLSPVTIRHSSNNNNVISSYSTQSSQSQSPINMDHIAPLLRIIFKHCHNLAHLQENSSLKVETKPDKTFVTNLDRDINEKLERDIMAYLKGYGDGTGRVVAEESWKNATPRRDLSKGTVVYIDPIDGTHAFIDGGDDWCIMCGLAVDGVPKVGIVWAPRMDSLWYAASGCGAFKISNSQLKQWYEGSEVVERDGKQTAAGSSLPEGAEKISLSEVEPLSDAVVLRSSTRPLKAMDAFFQKENITKYKSLASMGVKCCMIAQNAAHLYVNSSCHYWDSCAPRVILEESGGLMLKTNGEACVYDGVTAAHDYLQVCGSPKLVKRVCEYLHNECKM